MGIVELHRHLRDNRHWDIRPLSDTHCPNEAMMFSSMYDTAPFMIAIPLC